MKAIWYGSTVGAEGGCIIAAPFLVELRKKPGHTSIFNMSEGKAQEFELTEGQTLFSKAEEHEAENIGKTIVDYVVVELKK